MHAIGLTIVDWLIIAVYFGFVLGIVSILGIIDIGGVNEVFNRVPEAFSKLWSTSGDPTQNGMMVTWGGIVISLFTKKKPAEELVGRDHGRRRRGVLFQAQVRDGRIVGESSCRI